MKKLKEKTRESLLAVLPITGVVLAICLTFVPVPVGVLALFVSGAVLLTAGMGLFSLGVEMSMMPMGRHMGAKVTGSRKLGLICALCFAMGLLITVAEPDLTVLASQLEAAIPPRVLIYAVGAGVGMFLVLAFLRIIFQLRLSTILTVCYAVVFALAVFASESFLPMSFDAGGVTTGPITVPFIMALGIGLSGVRSDKSAADDSFGLVAICSVGPVLAVMVLGLFYRDAGASYAPVEVAEIASSRDILMAYLRALPTYLAEVALALAPMIGLFALFQLFWLKLPRRELLRMGVGLAYTYVGLVLFLTGANVGFMPAGNLLGGSLAALEGFSWLLIPLGMVIGFFIVRAEPAVAVLNHQVEEITEGQISGRAMQRSLSAGIAVSVGLAMLRVLTGISIWWCVVPGYAIAIGLSLIVPRIFTAVAFDAGGVASGPMTAAFLLPLAMGACEQLGGNVLTDAFGVVAMVAMTPLIAVQISGLVYVVKKRRQSADETPEAGADDTAVIDIAPRAAHPHTEEVPKQ